MARRSSRTVAVVAALVCSGLGAGAMLAVQASASGGKPTPASAPKVPAVPKQGAIGPNAAVPHVVAPHALATNAHCGQVVTASLTLNGDLDCTTSGVTALTINAASITLNLNGFTVSGPGNGTGILVNGSTDTVKNGVVGFFFSGVFTDGVTDTITTVRAVNNNYGIVDVGSKTKLTSNVAAFNSSIGIDAGSPGGVDTTNHALNNGTGMDISGDGAVATSNVANGNLSAGIVAFAGTLTKNVADFNATDGIYAYTQVVIDGAGNTAHGNNFDTVNTPDPVQCEGIVCS